MATGDLVASRGIVQADPELVAVLGCYAASVFQLGRVERQCAATDGLPVFTTHSNLGDDRPTPAEARAIHQARLRKNPILVFAEAMTRECLADAVATISLRGFEADIVVAGGFTFWVIATECDVTVMFLPRKEPIRRMKGGAA